MIQPQRSSSGTFTASRIGRCLAGPVVLSLLNAAGLFLMLTGATLDCRAQVLGWDPSVARTISYSVTVEHGLKEGQPEFVEHDTLTLRFLGDGRIEITRQGRAPVTFQTTTGGNLRITSNPDTPPYIAVLLLDSLPATPTGLGMEAAWETRFPTDADLKIEDDKLGLQDRLSGRVRDTQGDMARIDVEGQVRAVRNSAAVSVLGEALSKYESLFRWNLYLTGEVEFRAATKSVKRAEFFYVFEPIPDLTREQLMKERAREHAVVELSD